MQRLQAMVEDLGSHGVAHRRGAPIVISAEDLDDLRRIVLDEQKELRQVAYDPKDPLFADIAVQELLNHDVIELIVERFHSQSVPGQRSDNATLALALEGGGMRGTRNLCGSHFAAD